MMGSLSIWHWLILAGVAAVLFGGKGKLSSIMGDAAKGVKAFRDGLKGEEDHAAKPSVEPVVHISDVKVRDADDLKR